MKALILLVVLLPVPAGMAGQFPEDNRTFENGLYAEFYLVRHDFSNGLVSFNYERQGGRNKKSMYRAGINLFVSWPTLPSPSFSAGFRF